MQRATTFGLILFLMLGCTTPEQREEQRKAQLEKDAAEAYGVCKGLGFTDNTDAMILCIQTTYANMLNERAYQQQQMMAVFQGMQQAGQALQQGNNQNTNSRRSINSIGGHLNCTVQPNGKQLYCW